MPRNRSSPMKDGPNSGDGIVAHGPQEVATKHQQQLFKTKLCRFFVAGRCRYGADCPFAHHELELAEQPDFTKTSLCKDWMKGLCAHTSNVCRFAHGDSELRNVRQSMSPPSNSNPQDCNKDQMECAFSGIKPHELQNLQALLGIGRCDVDQLGPPKIQCPANAYGAPGAFQVTLVPIGPQSQEPLRSGTDTQVSCGPIGAAPLIQDGSQAMGLATQIPISWNGAVIPNLPFVFDQKNGCADLNRIEQMLLQAMPDGYTD